MATKQIKLGELRKIAIFEGIESDTLDALRNCLRLHEGVPDSAHTRGYAVDISAITKSKQVTMLKALHEVGFRRFGIYETFIHVDNDPDKPTPSIWAKGGATIHYNPLNA